MADYSYKEINQKKYKKIIKRINSYIENENGYTDQDKYKICCFLVAIVVSHCQPEITTNRIGKMLEYFGLSNLEILDFLDELHELKKSFDTSVLVVKENISV